MKRKEKNLGIEIIVILSVFIFIILVLSRAFVMARAKSVEASRLSDAVTLASNCADLFLACDDKELEEILNEKGNAEKGDPLTAYYDDDLRPAKDGRFKAEIHIDTKGNFEKAEIRISYDNEEIYAIETGREVKE